MNAKKPRSAATNLDAVLPGRTAADSTARLRTRTEAFRMVVPDDTTLSDFCLHGPRLPASMLRPFISSGLVPLAKRPIAFDVL
jgi:hypothetical protein